MYRMACMSNSADMPQLIHVRGGGRPISCKPALCLASGFCAGFQADWHGFRSVCCTPDQASGWPLGWSGATQNNNGSAQMNSLSEKAGASAPGHSPASPVAANLDTLRLGHADYRGCVGNVGSSISMLYNGGRHDA